MLHAGEVAPEFALPDADMEWFDFHELHGRKNIVLFFYPRDGTPYCTMEAADFSDHEDDFTQYDCVVVGVSPDCCETHADFRDKNGLSIRLLSDEEREVCEKFGVCQCKEQNGHTVKSVVRSTFIIDKQGVIRHALYDVNPRGHAAEVYQLVKSLAGKAKAKGKKHADH